MTRLGFFTDTSLCIGCKACEVACKEWNDVPMDLRGFLGSSYDNSYGLGPERWRHVAFVEQGDGPDLRWLMSSDVCKHCTHAACLEVCPTGALFRTEYDTVVVQSDICNGCGYCVPACPFGVLDKREGDGRVWKCTLCYDRLKDDQTPACAQACPTKSIQFGPLEELRRHAQDRVDELVGGGQTDAQLYLAGGDDGVGGAGAFFLLLDDPEVYGLPPDPVDPVREVGSTWAAAGAAALALGFGVVAAVFAGRR